MKQHILIVDDEVAIRESLQGLFEDESYRVSTAASGEEAVAMFRNQPADCVLMDIWMSGIDGLEALSRLRQFDADLPVIMMSGHATIDTAVRATREGAFDFVEKPLSSDKLLILVRNAVEKRRLQKENQDLKKKPKKRSLYQLIGQSPAIEASRKLILRLAHTQTPVLITGEHGSGKAVAARMLHEQSSRADQPFIEVNTSSISEARVDAEFFGYEQGAFPGAVHAKAGLFERAHKGCMFLDELMGFSLAAQAKLVQVMQARRVTRLSGVEDMPIDVRLIASSAKDLEAALADHSLREDLFYRLNVVTIHMPCLRDRLEDLELLMQTLMAEHLDDLGGEPVQFDASAIAQMRAYAWPGNVRELRNYLERCHILFAGETLSSQTMPSLNQGHQERQRHQSMADGFHQARERFERDYLLQHLQQHDWNISRTAEAIGIERSQLHRKLKQFKLSRTQEHA